MRSNEIHDQKPFKNIQITANFAQYYKLVRYKANVPDLKWKKRTKYLKQACEQTINYTSMQQISAIFEIYKLKLASTQ
jgi:hypothetical protein